MSSIPVFETEIVKKYRVGQQVNLPFLNWKIEPTKMPKDFIGKEILIRFNSFDETVTTYKGLEVEIDVRAGSIIRLGMQGTNKERMVDYLNATVLKLIERQLEQKNKFADNTIAFIDETLLKMEGELKDSGEDLKDFSRKNNILDIEDKGANFKQLLTENDIKKQDVERKLAYLNALKTYLNGSVDFSKLPAPTVAGIDEPNIVNNVAKLISLSIERSNMVYSAKGNIFYERVDNEIMSVKKVLLENANSLKNALQYDLRQVDTKLSQLEGEVKKLPETNQAYLNISRKYDLSSNIYNTYLQKRSEASIVKAANLSDIQFIDPAKDVGGGLLGPKTAVNYVLAFFIGLFIPLVIVFFIFFISNSIQNIDDISTITQIPIIGIVGVKHTESNLSVFGRL